MRCQGQERGGSFGHTAGVRLPPSLERRRSAGPDASADRWLLAARRLKIGRRRAERLPLPEAAEGRVPLGCDVTMTGCGMRLRRSVQRSRAVRHPEQTCIEGCRGVGRLANLEEYF